MRQMFGIDFGSAYTKVALRTDPDKASVLVEHRDLKYDRLKICVPSVVSIGRSGKYYCGTHVVRSQYGNPEFNVFRNWKSGLFSARSENGQKDEAAATSDPKMDFLSRLESASQEKKRLMLEIAGAKRLEYEDVVAIASSDRLTLAQLREVARELMIDDFPSETTAARAVQDTPTTSPDIKAVAREYFSWLRAFIGGACKKHGLPAVDDVPVRVCLPAFTDPGQAKSEELLIHILEEAGWQLDKDYPVVSEPYSNAIGVLTRGSNCTWKPYSQSDRRYIKMQEMFNFNGLVEAYRSQSVGKKKRPSHYTILVIDMGAYTTDLATLKFDLNRAEIKPEVGALSEPAAVTELEKEVKGALSSAQKRAIEELPLEIHEEFRSIVYSEGKPYMSGNVEIEKKGDLDIIRGCISHFGKRIAEDSERFLEMNHIGALDELVLTGGGMSIPLIRESVYQVLKPRGVKLTHWPQKDESGGGFYKLDDAIIRGGSALGGASVFFDRNLS